MKMTHGHVNLLPLLIILALASHTSQGENFMIKIGHDIQLVLHLQKNDILLGFPVEEFSQSEEHDIAQDALVTTYHQKKTWRITFELYPTKWPTKGTQSIFQFTQGESKGKFGTRSPAMFLQNGAFLILSTYLRKSRKVLPRADRPPLNQWTELVFEQREEAGGEYVFAFSQAGQEVYSLQNDNPREYTDLKVAWTREPLISKYF